MDQAEGVELRRESCDTVSSPKVREAWTGTVDAIAALIPVARAFVPDHRKCSLRVCETDDRR